MVMKTKDVNQRPILSTNQRPIVSTLSIFAQVGGKKELTGRTDIEIEISNQCARLIANAIIYYNSAILSHLLTKYEGSSNAKAVALITQMSPAAWRQGRCLSA